MSSSPGSFRNGLLYGLVAYGVWGIVPAYFKALAGVPPLEVLAHRIVWSLLFLAGVLTVLHRWPALFACLRSGRRMAFLLVSTNLIALNWFVFIHGVSIGQVLQTALGYFVTPLVNVAFGLLIFRERLRSRQWLALGLATAGVTYLAISVGEVPWIALTLSLSFGLYGVLRKAAPVESLIGLSVETLLLAPLCAGYLACRAWTGEGALGTISVRFDVLLIASGVITAIPLLCFGEAARRLPLSTLGFVQYISPTLSFLLAVAVFGEPFTPRQMESFALIWGALALYSVDALLAARRPPLHPIDISDGQFGEEVATDEEEATGAAG